jgi:fibronectin type 3 domain-containing protein
MRIRFSHLALFILMLILIIGCSSGGNTPVMPGESLSDSSIENQSEISKSGALTSERDFSMPEAALAMMNETYHSLATLGSFELNLNAQDFSAELIPMRKSAIGESYLVSGAGFFTMSPCVDCLTIESIELTGENYAKLNFNISHPFDKADTLKPPSARNRLDLDVFDLALVVVPSDASVQTYPLIGVNASAGLCPYADGYTRELKYLTEVDDACPYFLVIDDSKNSDFTYNKFEMGTDNQKFSAYFTDEGTFELYLTMGYGASARKFTRFTPQYYNPEFNRKSAWKVDIIPPEGDNPPEIGNTWTDSDSETEYPVTIRVYDWQQNAVVSPDYPDENHRDYIYKASNVSLVSLEIPGMTNNIKSTSTPAGGTGTPSDPLTFSIPIANENLLAAGDYFGLVKVSDERTPATLATPGAPDALVHTPDGIDINWLLIDEYATYQVFKATVVIGEQIIVTNPNGGETWIFSEPATIEWTWQGTTQNVNIELSLDSGQNYTIPIANNYANSGSFDLAQVGEWITETARIRIYNSIDNTIIDESDSDFIIVCPDLDHPSNVVATDGDFHDRIRLTWDAYAGATGYNIYRNDALQVSDYPNTSWDDMNASPGTVYSYQVQTVKGQCTSPKSSYEYGYACVLPDTPTDVSATDGNFYNKVTVTWSEANLATGYNIIRDSVEVESNWPNTTWDDTNVVMGVNYTYQVQSVNDCGPSNLSTGDVGHACVLPGVPANVSATDGLYYNKVTVTWNAASLADSYNIYRNGAIRQSNWTGGTTWDDTTAAPGVIYSYQVQSVNTCGTSALSTADNGNACELPGNPTGLTASDGTYSNRVHLAWNAASLATSYNIYRNNILIQSNVVGTSWDDYSASGGTIYSYEVEAVNSCGTSTARSNIDTGWYPGCASDSDNTSSAATRIEIDDSKTGCVDMIDEDWFWFYVTPNGFTANSAITLTVNGNVDVTLYGHDPGGTCPGNTLQTWTDVGSGTLDITSASSMSKIFIKLKGHSGQVNYTMVNNFEPVITNFPVEIWVATTNGTSTGTWPTSSSETLTVGLINQMLTWCNNLWNQYGYNLVWDGTPSFLPSQYYVLNSWSEESQMHDNHNSNGAKCDLYFVDQLVPGYNTAYCWVFENQWEHNVNNVYTVYSPNIWYWEDVIAHEYGHAIGYFNDVYMYGQSGCPCGNHTCFENYFGYVPYLYDNTISCYNGNLMWYYVTGWTWDQFDLTDGQYNYIHEFHYNNPTNYPWY